MRSPRVASGNDDFSHDHFMGKPRDDNFSHEFSATEEVVLSVECTSCGFVCGTEVVFSSNETNIKLPRVK